MTRSILLFFCLSAIGLTAAAQEPLPKGPEYTPELNIISWNIHMLPYCVYAKTKKRKRAKAIVEAMDTSEYNVIVFQEAFHHIVRKKMKKALKEKYPYSYGPANRKFMALRANSGIWILSDRPMIYVDEIQFEHAVGDGKLARKGVLMMEGEWYGHRYQILGMHNNGGWVNNSQFHEVRYKLLDKYHQPGVPQIICGDYNTKANSADDQWNAMLRLFDVEAKPYQHDDRTQPHKDSIPAQDVYRRFPDFIFFRKNGNESLIVDRIATISLGPTWVQEPKKIYLRSVGLSDHYPVISKIRFRNWE